MKLKPVGEIRDPVHGYVRMTEVERELIDSPFIQRLRRVHQLAGSYLVYPGAVHTRFEHVVGAMHVAGKISESLAAESEINDDQMQEIRLAALLHDTGHGPFSHTYEEVLAEVGDTTHEDISQRVVTETSIKDTLEGNGFSSRRISKLCVGRETKSPFMNEIIAGGLSADIMDYLPRDSYFTGVEYGRVDVQRIIDSLHVADGHLALDDAAAYAFEAMLIARYQMFKTVYFHRTVRAAELMLVHSMQLADEALGLTDLSDLDSYLELTDEIVLHRLSTLKATSRKLRDARGLALDFQNRRLVKCVYERLVQRKDRVIGQLFANGRVRRQVTLRLADSAKVDPSSIYVDVPTTPSVPNTYSKEALTSVKFLKMEGRARTEKTVPLTDLPLVGSIGGFMNMLRVYTKAEDRLAVETAATNLFKGQEFPADAPTRA